MFLFPKSIVYFFKNSYFTSLQNLVPSLQRIKIQLPITHWDVGRHVGFYCAEGWERGSDF